MRRLVLLALIAASAACYGRQWVPVQVNWTFGGQFCDAAGVDTIQIDVEGETLTPNQFTCTEAGQGATLGDFLTGPYVMTVTGMDSAGNVLYQTTQNVQVRLGGLNVINIDAAPTTGDAAVHWSFAGKTCDAAGVQTVKVSIDGQVITDDKNNPNLPCKGTNFEGTTIGPLTPGSHSISLAASGASDDYAADATANITAGKVTTVPVNLAVAAPTTASADVRWLFEPGDKNCAQIGADTITVVFDPQSNGSGGTVVATTACAGMGGVPVTEIQIVDVPDGNHSFAIRATKNNSLVAYTHHPVTTLFSAPFMTRVDVTAEPLP